MFHKLYKKIVSDTCCLCDNNGFEGIDLCHFCHKSLPHNHYCCFECALPNTRLNTWTNTREGYDEPHSVCGRCLSSASGIDQAIIPYLYRPPIDFMIKRFKFSEEMKYSRLLGDLLADAVETYYIKERTHRPTEPVTDLPECIIPVPVHNQRLLQRGFNQAEQIARTVANRIDRPCDTKAIVRIESKLPQSSLSAAQREANIRRAFEVKDASVIQGLHVAVVDDVYTTGATARAMARHLKSAGAVRVSVWAVARTP